MNIQHPVTLYGFVLGLVSAVCLTVLAALHVVSGDVVANVLVALGVGGVGAAAGVASPVAAPGAVEPDVNPVAVSGETDTGG